jgi:hypothetical protein
MNLYSNLVPAGRPIVVVQRGLVVVYFDAESCGAEFLSQLPSCEMEPAILIDCPNDVVVLELKVTATVATGVVHPVAVVEDETRVEGATLVADDEILVDVGLGGVEPVILISAHVRYTCGVWKEFHRSDSNVWFDV